MLSTTLKTVNTFVVIAKTYACVILSVTGFGTKVIPISTGFVCGRTLKKD